MPSPAKCLHTVVSLLTSLSLFSGSAMADQASDTETLLNWAETTYSQIFTSRRSTQTSGPWIYRYYPEAGVYAGVNKEDKSVYVMGGPWGNAPQVIGPLDVLMNRVKATTPADCSSGDSTKGYKAAAADAPTIVWDEAALSVNAEIGSSSPYTIAFTSNVELRNATYLLSSGIGQFVELLPSPLPDIQQCKKTSLTLRLRAPSDQTMGHISGTLQIQAGNVPASGTLRIDANMGIPFEDDLADFTLYLPSFPDIEVTNTPADTTTSGELRSYALTGIEGAQSDIFVIVYRNNNYTLATWYERNKASDGNDLATAIQVPGKINGLEALTVQNGIMDVTNASTYFLIGDYVVEISTQFTGRFAADASYFKILNSIK